MEVIAKRVCATSVTGVTVGITLRRDSRGAIPREEQDAPLPQNELGPSGSLTYFDGESRFAQESGKYWWEGEWE